MTETPDDQPTIADRIANGDFDNADALKEAQQKLKDNGVKESTSETYAPNTKETDGTQDRGRHL